VRAALLEAMGRRAGFLREVAERPGAPAGIEVLEGRAEDLARSTAYEGRFELVVARSFGPPATTAECAARFVAPDGWVLVSEPPDAAGSRWDPEGLGLLGLAPVGPTSGHAAFQAIRRVGPTPERFPRRNGVPRKRPLF
jgi:16S rRNA (guanine527-N7)-methyltransferase